MRIVWRWLDGWSNAPGHGAGDGMEIWLNNAVVATALVVALSNVFMARVLFQFYHHRADHFRAPRFWCCSPAS